MYRLKKIRRQFPPYNGFIMNLWIRNFENIIETISSPQMGQIDGE